MTVTANYRSSFKIPVEPSVLCCYLTVNSTEVLIPVPWKHCRLSGATLSIGIANGAAATATVDLELDAPSGSIMCTVTVGNSQAAGSLLTGVMAATASYSENLDRNATARDHVNVAVTKGSSTNWTGMLYMYFEPMI